MNVCGMERMPVHILRYMGQTSNNNNKVLINNSLCCFVIQVIYTQSTVTWDKSIYMRFPCLDYSFDILISGICKSSLYSWFCLYSILSILSVFYWFYDVFIVYESTQVI